MVLKCQRVYALLRATVLILAAVMAGGCAAPAGDHEEDAHALPEHHPRTFRRAVVDIGHRGGVLTSGMLEGPQWELQRRQLLDIVRWLPELAADTDLGRRDWERVNDVARTLARELESLADAGEPQASRQKTLPTTLADAMKTLSDADALLPPDIPQEEKP
jgi:hypothetical protein